MREREGVYPIGSSRPEPSPPSNTRPHTLGALSAINASPRARGGVGVGLGFEPRHRASSRCAGTETGHSDGPTRPQRRPASAVVPTKPSSRSAVKREAEEDKRVGAQRLLFGPPRSHQTQWARSGAPPAPGPGTSPPPRCVRGPGSRPGLPGPPSAPPPGRGGGDPLSRRRADGPPPGPPPPSGRAGGARDERRRGRRQGGAEGPVGSLGRAPPAPPAPPSFFRLWSVSC